MKATRAIQKILQYYETDNPGVKGNLCRILMNGKLGGTGKLIILPVDQGNSCIIKAQKRLGIKNSDHILYIYIYI